MKLFWLFLLLPLNLLAQTHTNKSNDAYYTTLKQVYTFKTLRMDDFITTSPDNGGTAKYNIDKTGMNIDGEIDVNIPKKYISIRYNADKKDVMMAIIEKGPKYDSVANCYTIKAHWQDSNEKTEISIPNFQPFRTIKVLFGPHKGDHCSYWDRVYNYDVVAK